MNRLETELRKLGLLHEAAAGTYAAELTEVEWLGLVSAGGLAAEVRRGPASLQVNLRVKPSSYVCAR